MKVSAILLKYKRLDELNKIISSLKKQSSIIDEILIFDNRKINLCGYWRYFGALNAKNDIIYVQDDDVIVNNIPELFNTYINLKNQNNEQVVNNITKSGAKRYNNYNQTLMGWGSLYPKSSIGVLNNYILYYGIDELFLRDISRIYTGLINKWTNIIVTEGKEIISFPSASSKISALCMQGNHEENRIKSIKRINLLKESNNENPCIISL